MKFTAMAVPSLVQQKQALRVEIRAWRLALDLEQAAGWSGRAAGHLLAYLKDIGFRGQLAGYWPLAGEADPSGSYLELAALGLGLSLPVSGGNGEMAFHRWSPGEPLIPGRFGVMEPASATPIIIPDLILCPLVGFDDAGRRLGFGGGYYDRALRKYRVPAIGFGFAGQRRAALPDEPHDQKLQAVVTEAGVTLCLPSGIA